MATKKECDIVRNIGKRAYSLHRRYTDEIIKLHAYDLDLTDAQRNARWAMMLADDETGEALAAKIVDGRKESPKAKAPKAKAPKAKAPKAPKATRVSIVLECLRQYPTRTASSLAAELGLETDQVSKSLNHLKNMGCVRRFGENLWELMPSC